VNELTARTHAINFAADRLANVAINAERTRGDWPQDAGILMLYGDVGLGGAYQSHSDVFYGDTGLGANFGHLVVEFAGRPCYCGQRGCLETYVGVGPLLNALNNTPDELANSPRVPLNKALDAVRRQAPGVAEELAQQGRWLARAIQQITAVLDPAVVILGGALAEFAPVMLPTCEEQLRPLRIQKRFGRIAEIMPSRLGPEAISHGGIVMSAEAVIREPWRLQADSQP
jgi:predicted NBD/HSP70 family sugar kinase